LFGFGVSLLEAIDAAGGLEEGPGRTGAIHGLGGVVLIKRIALTLRVPNGL